VNKKLYVGNLAYSVTEAGLRELFAQAGEVSTVSIITDRDTGRAKGFAFVDGDGRRALNAIKQISGKTSTSATSPRRGPPAGACSDFGGGGQAATAAATVAVLAAVGPRRRWTSPELTYRPRGLASAQSLFHRALWRFGIFAQE
jgi:hypothetical protein